MMALSTNIHFSHSIGRGDREKGAISQSLSLLLLWISLLSDSSCGKQQDSTHTPSHLILIFQGLFFSTLHLETLPCSWEASKSCKEHWKTGAILYCEDSQSVAPWLMLKAGKFAKQNTWIWWEQSVSGLVRDTALPQFSKCSISPEKIWRFWKGKTDSAQKHPANTFITGCNWHELVVSQESLEFCQGDGSSQDYTSYLFKKKLKFVLV